MKGEANSLWRWHKFQWQFFCAHIFQLFFVLFSYWGQCEVWKKSSSPLPLPPNEDVWACLPNSWLSDSLLGGKSCLFSAHQSAHTQMCLCAHLCVCSVLQEDSAFCWYPRHTSVQAVHTCHKLESCLWPSFRHSHLLSNRPSAGKSAFFVAWQNVTCLQLRKWAFLHWCLSFLEWLATFPFPSACSQSLKRGLVQLSTCLSLQIGRI